MDPKEMPETTAGEPRTQQRRVMAALTVAAVVVLLAGGAFTAMRMLGAKAGRQGSEVIGADPGVPGPGGGGKQTFSLQVERAKELPAREPDVVGKIEKRIDDTLVVSSRPMGFAGPRFETGKGGAKGMTKVEEGSGETTRTEIVVTGKTKIYRDDTDLGNTAPGSQGGVVEQKVTLLDALPDLGNDMSAQAWGRRVGDRLIAEIIVLDDARLAVGGE